MSLDPWPFISAQLLLLEYIRLWKNWKAEAISSSIQSQRTGVCRDHRHMAAEACEWSSKTLQGTTFPPLLTCFLWTRAPFNSPLGLSSTQQARGSWLLTYPLNDQRPPASIGKRSDSGKMEKLKVFAGSRLCKGTNPAAPCQSNWQRGESGRVHRLHSTGQKGKWRRGCGEGSNPWAKINQFWKSLNPCFLASAFNLLKAVITNPSSLYSVESLSKIQGLVLVY